jgi:LysM repeat protein
VDASASYTVKEGDTLSALARQYRSTVADLARANGLAPDATIRVGQGLRLPAGVWSDRLGIRVSKPAPGAKITAPVTVEGTAATFEGQVMVEVLAADGSSLGKVSVKTTGGGVGDHGDFRASVPLPASSAGSPVTIRLYWPSPRDGVPMDEVRIPVTVLAS